MLFTDPFFLFFFLPIVLALYYIAPRGAKNLVLVAASILFYSLGEGYYTLLVLFSIVFNYLVGLWIDATTRRAARMALTVGVAINLGVLIAFKYAEFGVLNLNVLLAAVGAGLLHVPHWRLPLGISFFTFHALSYLIDVWRREVPALRRPTYFALYITLFPQLIAGPIIRYKTICDQFPVGGEKGRRHSWEKFAAGVRRFIIGLGKKMLIANIVGSQADLIFSLKPLYITPGVAWLGIVCYTLQIYFDFSGYSDMAIGLGRMFGFVFPENFNYPYIAASITDFWRRWHITLSTWFRDYLYIPLGGNRVSRSRVYLNLLIVFFLCGLWHGAMWTFVAWGMFHGVFLIIERMGLKNWLDRHPIARHFYALLIIMVGWVLFRSPSIVAAGQFLMHMAFLGGDSQAIYGHAILINHEVLAAMVAGVLGSLPVVPAIWRYWSQILDYQMFNKANDRRAMAGEVFFRIAEIMALATVFYFSISLCAQGTYNPFIYFRF
jgi:alginate O-acetyltransferase complex protein AlgI